MTRATFAQVDGPAPIAGDMKFSFLTADHSGWIRLDGRALTALTATQRATATGLGIATSLPNAASRNFRQKTPLSLGGTATSVRALIKANLPSYNMTVTSNKSANTHTHSLSKSGSYRYDNAPPRVRASNTNGGSPLRSISLSTDGAHTHAYTLDNGGSGTAFDVKSAWVSVSAFMYLGA